MPSILERISAGTRALVGTADVRPGGAGEIMLAGIQPGAVGDPPRRGTQQLLEAYAQMPWMHAIADRIASDIAAVPWRLYVTRKPAKARAYRHRAIQRVGSPTVRRSLLTELARAGELTEIADHIFLDTLDRANAFHTGQQLRYTIQVHQELVGETFLLKERNALGVPESLWPIPPHWVISTPTVRTRTFRISYRGWQATIPDTEILWMQRVDPLNPYGRGVGRAAALADEFETDEFAAKTTRQLFGNLALPRLIISAPGLQEAETKRAEEDWNRKNQGIFRMFKTHFFNREIKVEQIDTDFRSLQFVQLREHERNTFIQVWGSPPEIFGIVENSNRATIEAADYLYGSKVLVPRLEYLRAIYQERLIPEYDERLVLDYVSPVSDDKTHALAAAQAQPAVLTVDEWRELSGHGELPGGKGKVHLVPVSISSVESFEEISASLPPAIDPMTGLPSAESGAVPPANGNGDGKKPADEKPAENGKPADEKAIVRAVRRSVQTAIHNIAVRLEGRMRRAFLLSVDQLRGRIDLEALEAAVRAGTTSAIEAATYVDQMVNQLGPVASVQATSFREIGAETAKQLRGLGIDIAFNATNPRATAWVERHGARLVREISDETRSAIRALVETAFREQALTPRQLAREIRDVVGLTTRQATAVYNFETRLLADGIAEATVSRRVERYAQAQLRARSMNIARTEIMFGSNNGQQEMWQQAADAGYLDREKTRRVWVLTEDDRLCEELCEPMEGETVGLDETFELPDGTEVETPPAHPQCRCTVALEFER